MYLLAHYLVRAGTVLLLIGLRSVAHGGVRGPGAPAGDGLRLVSICSAMMNLMRQFNFCGCERFIG